ncbi:hypothetical protein GCM10007414_30360 [Agarivorans gilvus]|uniref:Uncharacterized protein n=1 Tax=Agarivorans gilvus TaxID=680279 RepID=A0ABQ1I6J4_9ALTE|nr:hypothetical protein GCM10007414_30360 [Agarivorans gilvus]
MGFIVTSLMSLLGFYYECVWAYGKVQGLESFSKFDDPHGYWYFIVVYVNTSLLCLFIALKENYPYRLRALMNFNLESRLKPAQVVFAIVIAAIYFGTAFYVAELQSKGI